jgi:hypothetical protein
LLIVASAQAKDIGDNSQPAASADDIGKHIIQYTGSDASELSLGAYSKFLIPSSMHRKDGGRPDASKTVASAKFSKTGSVDEGGIGASASMRAQDSMTISSLRGQPSQGTGKETEKLAVQKLLDAGRSTPIELSAIFASLLALSAILRFRMRSGRSPSPALSTASDENESGMSNTSPPAWHDNTLELQSQGVASREAQEIFRSGSGWRPSSQNSGQLTVCYATGQDDDPTKVWYAELANGIQNLLTNSPLNEGKKAFVTMLAGDYDKDATNAKLDELIANPVVMLSFTK